MLRNGVARRRNRARLLSPDQRQHVGEDRVHLPHDSYGTRQASQTIGVGCITNRVGLGSTVGAGYCLHDTARKLFPRTYRRLGGEYNMGVGLATTRWYS